MSSLIHCIYASAATHQFEPDELGELLKAARSKNERLGLTGMLLYADGSFFQVLEGAPGIVDQVYARIEADPRHDRVTQIIRESIPQRAFAEWSMGFAAPTRQDLATLVGMNDFFSGASCFAGLGRGRAKKLLDAFQKGRWSSRRDESRQAVGA
ncbi:MAG: BLUF domain-containing protein [Burkholderiaceae bacterium]